MNLSKLLSSLSASKQPALVKFNANVGYHSLAMLTLASPQIYFKTYVLTWMFHVCKRCEVGVYGTVLNYFFSSPEGYELALSSCLTFFFKLEKAETKSSVSHNQLMCEDKWEFKSCMFSCSNIRFLKYISGVSKGTDFLLVCSEFIRFFKCILRWIKNHLDKPPLGGKSPPIS